MRETEISITHDIQYRDDIIVSDVFMVFKHYGYRSGVTEVPFSLTRAEAIELKRLLNARKDL